MRWSSALSLEADPLPGVGALAAQLREPLGGAGVDLVLVFSAGHDAATLARVQGELRRLLAPRTLLGCTAAGVIGGGHEVELEPALAVTAASLPGVELRPFRVEADGLPDLDGPPGTWTSLLGISPQPEARFLILADPFTCDPRDLLSGLDYAYGPGVKLGGLASAGEGNLLLLDQDLHRSGVVGLSLQGDLELEAIVAQGCRPIGPPLTVTASRDHLLMEVEGRTPLSVLEEVYEQLEHQEQELFRKALLLGIAPSGLYAEDAPREFLVRNLVGVDSRRGVLAIGAAIRPGQTVQFHVRDAVTAGEDLERRLTQARGARPGAPAGGLLFSCTGRGRRLFGAPDHDSDLLRGALGDVPLGGFFCGGEIGPVHGATELHGYTSVFGLFRPASA